MSLKGMTDDIEGKVNNRREMGTKMKCQCVVIVNVCLYDVKCI